MSLTSVQGYRDEGHIVVVEQLDELCEVRQRAGQPRWKQTERTVTFLYRFASEDTPPINMRLKVEIKS